MTHDSTSVFHSCLAAWVLWVLLSTVCFDSYDSPGKGALVNLGDWSMLNWVVKV